MLEADVLITFLPNMEFKLHYEGVLKSNGNATVKHELRRYFHPQLKELWKYRPLKDYVHMTGVPPTGDSFTFYKKVGDYEFVPLVCDAMGMYAELDILILRQDISGGHGDMDNMLKTLLDGLRYPKVAREIPSTWAPTTEEQPLYCLLEDDELVTKMNIHVDRLLKPLEKGQVLLLITVKIKGNKATYGNLGLIL